MNKILLFLAIGFATGMLSCSQQTLEKTDNLPQTYTISQERLLDKIKGGWAGQTIGVAYGGPTEFRYRSAMIQDYVPISYADGCIKNYFKHAPGLFDDIYMDLTFVEVFDRLGIDAPVDSFAHAFAHADYGLWHANQAARYNILNGIMPPASGHWLNNPHADDIDYQIEADFAGLMTPGMPNTASEISDKIGHIMNYGDGWYGGVYIGAMYSLAFISDDINIVVQEALKTIPENSRFHQCMNDVIQWHRQYPNDWKQTWAECEKKWNQDIGCPEGTLLPYNIDAVINCAYVVMGLLYGEGDFYKTMDISTRCGQDSDCNPSNALAVLGIIKGFSAFPQEYREAIEKIGDKPFVHTNYSFNKAVERTADYAEKLIVENGGKVTEDSYSIVLQEPVALPMEDAFPNLVYIKRAAIVDADKDSCWTLKGNWQDAENGYVKYSEQAGDEITFTFEGTGASIEGWWVKNGGKADVYVDGIFKRTIDCFYYYAKQEHRNINIFHILNLEEGKHTINIVVKGEKREESEGCAIGVRGAIVFKNGTKSYDAI